MCCGQQDQLDDAHRPGEEKKEEERDCKEEEKGINMSDDFDSHLQDVEKKGIVVLPLPVSMLY